MSTNKFNTPLTNFDPRSRSGPWSVFYLLVSSFIDDSLFFYTGPGSDCMFLVRVHNLRPGQSTNIAVMTIVRYEF